tara:strand:- start:2236 stop:2775 length:540 start_codon:yes stop_codon:yes gene_type:complete
MKFEKNTNLKSDFETSLNDDEQLDLRIWIRLLTCTHLIEKRVRKNLRDSFNTTLPRFDALVQIDRTPDGQPMRELSNRMMVTNGNITPLVDRLVNEDLIKRDPSSEDRRVQHISLTQNGKEAVDEMIPAHSSWVNNLMSNMGRNQASDLLTLLGELKESILAAEEISDKTENKGENNDK